MEDLQMLINDVVPSLRSGLQDPEIKQLLQELAHPLPLEELVSQVSKVLNYVEGLIRKVVEEHEVYAFELLRNLENMMDRCITSYRAAINAYIKLPSPQKFNEELETLAGAFERIVTRVLGSSNSNSLIMKVFQKSIEKTVRVYYSLINFSRKLMDNYGSLVLNINRCLLWEPDLAEHYFQEGNLNHWMMSLNEIISKLQEYQQSFQSRVGFDLFVPLLKEKERGLRDMNMSPLDQELLLTHTRLLLQNKLGRVKNIFSEFLRNIGNFEESAKDLLVLCLEICREAKKLNMSVREYVKKYQTTFRAKFLKFMIQHELESRRDVGGITLLDVIELTSRVLGDFFFSQMLEEPSHKIVLRRETT